jgi:glucose-1-phosphate adenylyltransferase
MKDVLTFIMAGGKGERLYPLTRDRAKPAVPFGGIYRIIDFPLSNCINSGVRKIHILIQYKSMSLDRHLRMGWNIFDSELGEYIDVIPAQQRIGEKWYQGTADAIYQNIYAIQMQNESYILILAGDHIYKMDYSKLVDYHKQKGADLTVGAVMMPKANASQFGVIEADHEDRIVGFKEKPRGEPKTIPARPDFVYASMGIYVFSKDVLVNVLEEDSKKDTSHDFGKNIIPNMVASDSKVFAYNFLDEDGDPGYWRDIGTIDAYYEANMDLVTITPEFNLYDRQWPVRTYQEQFPPAKTVFTGGEDPGRVGRALDSIISNGCIISGGKVQRSILSPNVRINSYCEVEESILMEGVDVGRYAKVRRAIIDKDVKIPQGAEIGYNLERDKKNFYVTESGIVVVAKKTDIVV